MSTIGQNHTNKEEIEDSTSRLNFDPFNSEFNQGTSVTNLHDV